MSYKHRPARQSMERSESLNDVMKKDEQQQPTSGTQPSPFIVKEGAKEWGFLRALPSTVVGWILRAYRRIISPTYGHVCKFFPTCSAYGLEAVYTHGAIKGSLTAGGWVSTVDQWQDGAMDRVRPRNMICRDGKQPLIIELNHPVIPPDSQATKESKLSMGFFDTILLPFPWAVSWVLSIFHTLL